MSGAAVVLGAGGLLGRHLVEELGRAGHPVRGYDRAACDIGDEPSVRRALAGAALVVNCAAYTNVDGAERDEAAARRANVDGAELVAAVSAAGGARLVHLSTDFVFDGQKRMAYDELDRPNPRSAYARTKWLGEERARARQPRLYLVRVQGLYGAGGGNFASKLAALVRAGKSLTLDGERRVQPTWARAVARQLVRLSATSDFGTYHVSCKGDTTWADFAARLCARLGVAPAFRVVRSAELDLPAERPPNCLFQHRALELRDVDIMPSWEQALDDYLVENPV